MSTGALAAVTDGRGRAWPDYPAGTAVTVGPDATSGSLRGDVTWTVAGRTRHPSYVTVRESRWNTAVDVHRDRVRPA